MPPSATKGADNIRDTQREIGRSGWMTAVIGGNEWVRRKADSARPFALLLSSGNILLLRVFCSRCCRSNGPTTPGNKDTQ